MTRAAKRSRTARQPPPSESRMNNLPHFLLVEVLCRLPHIKVVFQCKRVCRRWCSILTDPYFVGRFLRLQCDQQIPLLNAYAMIPHGYREKNYMTSVLTMSSQPPYTVEDTKTSIFSILPCFAYQSNNILEKLEVVGTYNDLVLCSPSTEAQRYYICNYSTKQWVRLPPTPRVIKDGYVPVGFICDPYYSIKEEDTSNYSSFVKLNAEYMCKVVRLIPIGSGINKGFAVEIYSSDTGEWKKYQLSEALSSTRKYISLYHKFGSRCTGIAYNGKLYWWNQLGFVFELDPFNIRSTSNIIDSCRFIDAPPLNTDFGEVRHIGVCQGRLRMCASWFKVTTDPVTIWELKENQEDGKPEWCLICDGVSLSQMVHKPPSIFDQKDLISKVVGFHPSDGDILYLQFPGYTYMSNIRENTLEIATKNPFYDQEWTYECYQTHRDSYPLVFPWWPTPVPTRLHYSGHYNVTVTGMKNNLRLRLDFGTTLKQLKELLREDELYFNELLLKKEDDDMDLILLGIGEDSEIHVVKDCWGKPARRKRKRKRKDSSQRS